MTENLFALILGFGIVVGLTGAIKPAGKISAAILIILFTLSCLAAFGFTSGLYRFGYIHLAAIRMIILALTKHYYFLIFGAVCGIAFSLYEEGSLDPWLKDKFR